jgi:aryl-alcohol dehydrogenase-like predicted oxidoreductase
MVIHKADTSVGVPFVQAGLMRWAKWNFALSPFVAIQRIGERHLTYVDAPPFANQDPTVSHHVEIREDATAIVVLVDGGEIYRTAPAAFFVDDTVYGRDRLRDHAESAGAHRRGRRARRDRSGSAARRPRALMGGDRSELRCEWDAGLRAAVVLQRATRPHASGVSRADRDTVTARLVPRSRNAEEDGMSTITIPRRWLGQLETSALGLGCMGISFAYGPPAEESGTQAIHRALDLGITMIDTAEIYGPFRNEEVVGAAIAGRRDQVQLATKFGFSFVDGKRGGADGSPANAKRALEGSLKRLNVEYLDLWYQHRVDPNVPIEETVGAMAEAVKEGKVRYLGLSEASAATIRRAHAVHPITALQSEYSLWTRGVEKDVLPTLAELGIGFVPYSPLGRGFLTGTVTPDALDASDFRRTNPRFSGDAATNNAKLVEIVKTVAAKHKATPAQIALAWVLSRNKHFVPIPGTTKAARVDENAGALQITLDADDRAKLDSIASKVEGDRYNAAGRVLIEAQELSL